VFKKKWFLELSVYLVWIPTVALLFWVALQLRTAIEIGLSAFFVRDNPANIRVADIIDKYSFAALICIWIVVIVLIEAYLRNGIRGNTLIERFTRIFGPGLALLFLVDLFNLLMLEMNSAGWLRWLGIAGELLFGGGISYYGYIFLRRKKEPRHNPGLSTTGGK
jgi:hypothetical protein